MPVAGQSHDLTIEDGSAVKSGWMLQRGPQNEPAFQRKRAPIYTPAGRTGRSVYTTNPVPPAHDLTWEPDDFSFGFGMFRWSPWDSVDQQSRYAYADGIWTDTETELSLAQAVKEADILIQNPGMERGVTTGWTASGGATLAVGTSPNEGDFSFNIVVTSGNAGQILHTIANYQLLAGREITIRCVAKKTAGDGAEDWAIKIDDGVATTTGTAVVLTSAYQLLSCTRTINAGATKVDIILLRGTAPANATTVEADDWVETARCGGSGGAILKFITHRSKVYAMTPQVVFVWDSTNLKFSPVRMQPVAPGSSPTYFLTRAYSTLRVGTPLLMRTRLIPIPSCPIRGLFPLAPGTHPVIRTPTFLCALGTSLGSVATHLRGIIRRWLGWQILWTLALLGMRLRSGTHSRTLLAFGLLMIPPLQARPLASGSTHEIATNSLTSRPNMRRTPRRSTGQRPLRGEDGFILMPILRHSGGMMASTSKRLGSSWNLLSSMI